VLSKREQLYFAAAYLEILLLPLMLIKLVQGYGRCLAAPRRWPPLTVGWARRYVGLMGVIVYGQFIATRYRTNGRTREIAGNLLAQLDTIVYSYLPSAVGALYHRLRGGGA
jgi:hypothetical protein